MMTFSMNLLRKVEVWGYNWPVKLTNCQPRRSVLLRPAGQFAAYLLRYDRSAFLFTLIARPRQPAGFSFWGASLSWPSCSITTPCSSAGRYPFAVASCVRSRCAAGFPVPCGALLLAQLLLERVAHQRPHLVDRVLTGDLAADFGVEVLGRRAGRLASDGEAVAQDEDTEGQ